MLLYSCITFVAHTIPSCIVLSLLPTMSPAMKKRGVVDNKGKYDKRRRKGDRHKLSSAQRYRLRSQLSSLR
jgi:hypothetical protein